MLSCSGIYLHHRLFFFFFFPPVEEASEQLDRLNSFFKLLVT